jgi:hypothetical protein
MSRSPARPPPSPVAIQLTLRLADQYRERYRHTIVWWDARNDEEIRRGGLERDVRLPATATVDGLAVGWGTIVAVYFDDELAGATPVGGLVRGLAWTVGGHGILVGIERRSDRRSRYLACPRDP